MKKLFTFFVALLLITNINAQDFDIYLPKTTEGTTSEKEIIIKGYLKNFTDKKVIYNVTFFPKGWDWNFDWKYKITSEGKQFDGDKGNVEVEANDSVYIEIHILPGGKKGKGTLKFSIVGSDDPFSFVEDEINIIVSEGKNEEAPKPKKEQKE